MCRVSNPASYNILYSSIVSIGIKGTKDSGDIRTYSAGFNQTKIEELNGKNYNKWIKLTLNCELEEDLS
jgi:hypothetical protein